MTLILSMAIVVTMMTSLLLVTRWRNVRCEGPLPVSLFTFIAILFTSGLDVGLIMFPLVDFPIYESETVYAFANPLAIEFGFWGFLVWGFYFLTTFYFCIVEPRLGLFELPVIKWTNNIVIIGTCAFTGYLFLAYLPDYIEGIPDGVRFALVASVVLAAVLSSTHIRFVRILSVSSTWLFFLLIAGIWLASGMGWLGFMRSASELGEYFGQLHRFVLPISEYHEFYLFWWFAWSIMIGQFTARFVSGIRTWQLLIAMLVVPSIAIGVWFTVLYHYHAEGLQIAAFTNLAMISVGVLMVVNSLDSLIRLYTDNLNLTAQRLGRANYVVFNFLAMVGLTMLFQLDFLRIQWVGALVIALYFGCFVYILAKKRAEVAAIKASPKENILDFGKIELAG